MNVEKILETARTYDLMIEIFALLLAGAEADRRRAFELIKTLDAAGARKLRSVAGTLNNMAIDAYFDRCRDARIENQKDAI